MDIKDVDPKHLENAIYHAKLIQNRKDIEAVNLDALELLLDYPLASSADVEAPASSDMIAASELFQQFTHKDFDELVDERRRDNKCGYILCPKPANKQRHTGRMRIISSAGGLKAVPTEKLEAWCSRQCSRRAAYLKYQLNDEPAWLRPGETNITFSFPVGPVDLKTPVADLKAIKPAELDSTSLLPYRLKAGADTSDLVGLGQNILNANVVENKITQPPTEPALVTEHDTVEGYVIGSKKEDDNSLL